MGASRRLALEELLAGGALLARKPGSLLASPAAQLTRARDLTAPARWTPPAPLPGSAGGTERALDRLLTGLPKGRLVELVGRRTSGRHSLALDALAAVTSSGEAAGLVDLGDHLDPQAARAAGVDLERLLWVRPRRLKQALASAEMLLGTGFPLVVADLGLSPRNARFLPDAAWVRLSRAAQAQGARLLLLTPWRMSGIAAEAVVTSDLARPTWSSAGRSPRLLDGVSTRITLEKFGRETPGSSLPVGFRVAESLPLAPAILTSPDRPIDHPITRSPDHPIGRDHHTHDHAIHDHHHPVRPSA
jgi:hypothetical protein